MERLLDLFLATCAANTSVASNRARDTVGKADFRGQILHWPGRMGRNNYIFNLTAYFSMPISY